MRTPPPPVHLTFDVAYGQFVVVGDDGLIVHGTTTTGAILNTLRTDNNNHVSHAPVLSNGTWYVLYGSLIQSFSNSTSSNASYDTMSTIVCAAVQAPRRDIVVFDDYAMYVINSSGIFVIFQLAAPLGPPSSYGSYCAGAVFSEEDQNMLFVTFYGGEYGNAAALNYLTGDVSVQLAGLMNPTGALTYVAATRTFVVASQAGHILQHYQWPVTTSKRSFVAVPLEAAIISLVYNESNGVTYAIGYTNLSRIDPDGTVTVLTQYESMYSRVQPMIIGPRIVFFDTAYDFNNHICVYNAEFNVTEWIPVCVIDVTMPPLILTQEGTVVLLSCTDMDVAANAIDITQLSLTVSYTLQADEIRSCNGAVTFNDSNTLMITSGLTSIRCYNVNEGSNQQPVYLWTTHAPRSPQTPLVAFRDHAYVISSPELSVVTKIWRIRPSDGNATLLVQLPTPTVTSVLSFQFIATGPYFSMKPLMIVFGPTNVTAVAADTWEVVWNYESAGKITSTLPNSTRVLASGAVCFSTGTDMMFNVVDAMRGRLLWSHPTQAPPFLDTPPEESADMRTIYFSSPYSVMGADRDTGAVRSLSTYLTSMGSRVHFISTDAVDNTTYVSGVGGYGVGFYRVQVPTSD